MIMDNLGQPSMCTRNWPDIKMKFEKSDQKISRLSSFTRQKPLEKFCHRNQTIAGNRLRSLIDCGKNGLFFQHIRRQIDVKVSQTSSISKIRLQKTFGKNVGRKPKI